MIYYYSGSWTTCVVSAGMSIQATCERKQSQLVAQQGNGTCALVPVLLLLPKPLPTSLSPLPVQKLHAPMPPLVEFSAIFVVTVVAIVAATPTANCYCHLNKQPGARPPLVIHPRFQHLVKCISKSNRNSNGIETARPWVEMTAATAGGGGG